MREGWGQEAQLGVKGLVNPEGSREAEWRRGQRLRRKMWGESVAGGSWPGQEKLEVGRGKREAGGTGSRKMKAVSTQGPGGARTQDQISWVEKGENDEGVKWHNRGWFQAFCV